MLKCTNLWPSLFVSCLRNTSLPIYSSLSSKPTLFQRRSNYSSTSSMQLANDFLSFVNASPSPFHAVEESRKRLISAGFVELKEKDCWDGKIEKLGKYFFTRNHSSIVAFVVGGMYSQGNGFSAIGAHTDSPCLKVKPKSKKEKGGYLQVGVELYGGGLWHTWFDRDLGVAGRVMVHKENGGYEHKLVRITKPIMRIPTLAIHLDRGVNTDGFKFNTENQLCPILCSSAQAALDFPVKADEASVEVKHHPVLLKYLADEMGIQASAIGDFELCLFDTQPSQIGGALDEYIFSPRCDNLNSSFCALTAIINSGTLEKDPNIRVVALFDNEEIGSMSAHGADSNLLMTTFKRLSDLSIGVSSKSAFEQACINSYLISADMAHAAHPNYIEKHEENHRPMMNKGVVVKQNANQRYATTAVTTFILREVAKKYNVPLQEFVVRNDSPCGSTIGPMLSAKLGIRTIDVGNPQLSMHSIRETCGVHDLQSATDLFQAFFEHFPGVDAQIVVD